MRSRAQVVAFIQKQLDPTTKGPRGGRAILKEWDGYPLSCGPGMSHYGRCDLRALLDYIYEGQPDADDERLMGGMNGQTGMSVLRARGYRG